VLQIYLDTYIDTLKDIRESDLRALVNKNANIDEVFHTEMVTAFGLYATLEENEKQVIRNEAKNVTIQEILGTLADLNSTLFDAVERMNKEKFPIVNWLGSQLNRFKAIPAAFDSLIAHKQEWK
jgi:hypothetical protein